MTKSCVGVYKIHLPPRMKLLVDVAEVFVGDVGVYLRRGDIGMPQECLHGAEICTVTEEVGRKAVAKFMWGDFARDARDCCVLLDDALNTPRSES